MWHWLCRDLKAALQSDGYVRPASYSKAAPALHDEAAPYNIWQW